MAKVKVLDLAAEVGMEDDKLLLKLKRMGMKVKDKKPVEPEKVSLSDEKVIGRDSEKEIVEKRVKPTVIRRRTRNLEQQVEVPPPPPPLATAEIRVVEETVSQAIEEKATQEEVRVSKESEERKGLRKVGKPSTKMAAGQQKAEVALEPAMPVEAKVEEKEPISQKPVEGLKPSPIHTQRSREKRRSKNRY